MLRLLHDQFIFYQAGVRLQQLITLHDFAFGWKGESPEVFAPVFDAAIHRMWGVLADLSPKMPVGTPNPSKMLTDVESAWEARKGSSNWLSFDDQSEALPLLDELKEFLRVRSSHAPFGAHLTRCWYETGIVITDGEMSNRKWKWTHEGELQRLLKTLRVRRQDLAPSASQQLLTAAPGSRYPVSLKYWQRIDTGLARLSEAVQPPSSGSLTGEAATSRQRVLFPNDARDKWIYSQMQKGILYQKILANLKVPPWRRISSIQGLRNAAIRYAKRNGLPPIPYRQRRAK